MQAHIVPRRYDKVIDHESMIYIYIICVYNCIYIYIFIYLFIYFISSIIFLYLY